MGKRGPRPKNRCPHCGILLESTYQKKGEKLGFCGTHGEVLNPTTEDEFIERRFGGDPSWPYFKGEEKTDA